MKKLSVYELQNAAIHEARRQLEHAGILDPWSSLDDVRTMAAEINHGVASISKLSLQQRSELISRLIQKGARVKNPSFYESDLAAEAERLGRRRKVRRLPTISESQQRLIDALAAQIAWPNEDSLQRLCLRLFDATEPRNHHEVTQLAAVLKNIIERDKKRAGGDAD